MQILLERDEVKPDQSDNDGRIPFWCAAQHGHDGVVRTLLEQDEVNPDQSDHDGRTSLWFAAFNGHERVVKMLLQRNEVNPNKPHNDSRTPLWCAAKNGHDAVVKIFEQFTWVVRRSGSNPKLPNGTKLVLIRTTIIDERYQRTIKSKEIVCENE